MPRSVSVTGYVDMALDDVIRSFSDVDASERLLETAMAAAGSALPGLRLQASAPEQIAATSARIRVVWHLTGPGGAGQDGTASIDLLVLQSGHEPLTELLVTLVVDEARARGVAEALHRFLDELTTRLRTAAA